MDKKVISEIRRKAVMKRWSNGVKPEGEILTMRCPAAEAEELRRYARHNRISPIEALRRAVRYFLENYEV